MATVLVLGATSSIARSVEVELARRGRDLILAGRNLEEMQALAADLALRHRVNTSARHFDVLDFERQAEEIGELLAEAGDALEGVILAAGYYVGPFTTARDAGEARRVADVNFTGCVLALETIAAHFEKKGTGFICAISSVAGDRGREKNYVYGAAKAGLSAYLEGLRQRLFRVHVRVITIKPGFVDTPMTYGRPGLFLVATPERVGKSIVRAIERAKGVAYVPWFWRPIMFVVRHVPESLFKRMRV